MTGVPASGKGTFKDLLEEELDQRSITHAFYSLSDELRSEVRKRGLSVDRENLRAMGHELRQAHGSGVLSQRILDHLAASQEQASVVIIDAIRTPAEVSVLRQALAGRFTLVAVVANEDVVVERIRARGRSGDQLLTVETARQLLAAEMGLNEPDHGHNIAGCIALADRVVDNSGSLAELRARVTDLLEEQRAEAAL